MITFRSGLIFLIGLFAIVAATIFVETRMSSPTTSTPIPSTPALETPTELTKAACEQSGGTWNACGSACRETPNEPCIQVCVALCECHTSDQCPSGSVCEAFVDGVGICKK